MQLLNLSQTKRYFVAAIFFLLPVISSNAQGLLGKIKKGLQDANEIAYQTAVFTKLAGMTTAEVNNTVKVIKGNEAGTQGGTNGKVNKPKIKNGEFKNLTWEPITYFDNQLFPSCIIGMATYSGELKGEKKALSSPVGFRLKSKYSNMPIKWEIECVDNKYFEKQTGEIIYATADEEVFFMPDVRWNYDALGKQLASTPLTISFRLFDDDGNKVEKNVPVYIRSINDCIYRYKDNALDFLFTAFIQEEHPEIDKILREALDTKIVTAIIGYQGESDSSVHKQVEAIWRVLHDRGFQYSNITKTPGISNDISSQAVRTFDNAIKTNQANCVDGTIVFASILRKIGIHSVLVLTSNHCFLGYYTDPDRINITYLETTKLSDSRFIDAAKTAAEKKIAYTLQFLYARTKGTEQYKNYKAANDILTIDVDVYRNYVKPIPFQ
jgi:hypothetical protein